MANYRCTTALKQNAYDIKVGEILDSTHDAVVKWPSYFAVDESGSDTYLTDVIAVTVPAITDPDIAKVDVDISSDPLTFVAAVGDRVTAIPQEAMETNARILSAYVIGNDSIRVVFGSEGGNVTGGAKNFKFHMTDLT